jgi:hypothetical protein
MDADEILAQLTEGTVLKAPHWTEPVTVLTAKAGGSRIEVRVADLHTKWLWRKLLMTESETHLRTYRGAADAFTSVTRALMAKG